MSITWCMRSQSIGLRTYLLDNQPHINTGIATISSSGQPMRDVTIEVEGKQTIYTIPVDEIRLATNNEIISKGTTIGDILYLANMAYADFYPKVIKTESDGVQYAIAVASDPGGYEGMAFCRWTADIIGKGVTIDWEKLE